MLGRAIPSPFIRTEIYGREITKVRKEIQRTEIQRTEIQGTEIQRTESKGCLVLERVPEMVRQVAAVQIFSMLVFSQSYRPMGAIFTNRLRKYMLE